MSSNSSVHPNRSIRAILFIGLALLGLGFVPLSHADEPTQKARVLFEQYVALYRAFDPAVADLYSDQAKISNRRTYPNGEVRVLKLSGVEYKTLLRQVVTLAKARGDTSQYLNARYSVETSGVRIQLTRYSQLKKYTSAMSLLVGPDHNGRWSVLEEQSESVP
jgi:hypothetical protein